MSSLVLSQVTTSMFAPSIYGTIANGASVASAGGLWSAAQGIAGAIGAIAGSVLDRMLFTQSQHYQGPRLSDLSVQTSTEGASLPIVFGTMRLAGNVIWSTGLTEIATTEEQGGGSGGGGSSYTTYSYTTDCAVAICEGTITGIRRIWADTKLIYDVSETATAGTLVASSSSYAAGIRIYDGSETQLEDPLIQAVEGSAPAYRGTAYIVFEDLRLGDFGNRLPNFTFEVVKVGSAGAFSYKSYGTISSIDNTLVMISSISNVSRIVNYYNWLGGLYGYIGAKTTLATYYKNYITLDDNTEVLFSGNIGLPNSMPLTAASSCPDLPTTGILFTSSLASNNGFAEVLTTPENFHVIVREFYSQYTGGLWVGGFLVYFGSNDGRSFGPYPSLVAFGQLPGGPGGFGGAIGFKSQSVYVYCSDRYATPKLHINDTCISLAVDAINYGLSLIKFFDNKFVIGVNPSTSGTTKLYWYDYSGNLLESLVSTTIAVNVNCDISNDDYAYIPYGLSGIAKVGPLTSSATANNIEYFSATISGATDRYSNTVSTGMFTGDNVLVETLPHYNSGTGKYLNRYAVYTKNLQKTTQNLQTICEQIVAESLLEAAQYDFSALSDVEVRGYTITKQAKIRDAIEPLMSAYMFDLIEEDNKIVAKKASATLSKTLSQNELGTYQI